MVPETVLESDEEITNTNEILQAESQRTYAERASIVANERRDLNVAFAADNNLNVARLHTPSMSMSATQNEIQTPQQTTRGREATAGASD